MGDAATRTRDDGRPNSCARLHSRAKNVALHSRRDRERTVRLEPGRRDLWLDRRLIRPGHAEPAGDDGFAASERRSHVATTLAQAMEDVAVVRLGVTGGRR